MKFRILLVVSLSVFGVLGFAQFPSTVSYKLCLEIPKAKNIGDTVCVYTCMRSGEPYVLKTINKEKRYVYEGVYAKKI